MAIVRIQRTIFDIGAGKTEDYLFSLRGGGILLNLRLTNRPRVFFNVGTESESTRNAPIQAIVGDNANAGFILGQDAGGVIYIPTNQTWEWQNPFRQSLLDASSVFEKMAAYAAFGQIQPVGLIQGALRIIAAYDPIVQVSADVSVEAELIAFDANPT